MKSHLRNRISKYKNNLNYNFFFKRMIYKELKTINDKIIMSEIGTGYGDSSTIAIYKQLRKLKNDFSLICFEPEKEIFKIAKNNTKLLINTVIFNKYFLSSNSVDFLLTNVNKYIHDDELLVRIKKMYIMINPDELIKIDNVEIPNIVFIDSIRYSHFAIIKTLTEFNKDIKVIMEDDIPGFGELKIIQKHFSIRNIKYYRCFPHQWPFVAFNLISKV